jgi:hypothetical protein
MDQRYGFDDAPGLTAGVVSLAHEDHGTGYNPSMASRSVSITLRGR